MSLVKSLITSDKYGVKCPYQMTPRGICIHNTANDASAKNEVSYMKSNNNEVSYHIAVDDLEAIQAIPFNRNAWHAGDGGYGEGNRNYIAVEICYSKSGGSKFIAAEKRAAKEVATLLKEYGWTINNVKKHQDFSNKYCPHRTLDMGWQRFLNMIQAELNVLNGSSTQTPSSNQDHIKVGSKVRVVGSNYATGQSIPLWVKSNTYTVQQVNGDKCLLKEIVSWVYARDLQIVSSGNTAPSTPAPSPSKRYLNLKPHMNTWAIYNQGGPYTTPYKKGNLKPAMFGGISYEILGNPVTDVYIIQTRDYGKVAIWAPRDNDSSITNNPIY